MPLKIVEYIHRIGRTARGGAKGNSWALIEEHNLGNAREWHTMLEDAGQPVPSFVESAWRCPGWRSYYIDKYRAWMIAQREAKWQKETEAANERHGASTSTYPAARSAMLVGDPTASSSRMAPNTEYLSPNVDYSKPFFEKRENGPYCTLCNRYVDENHVASSTHTNREGWFYGQQAMMPRPVVPRAVPQVLQERPLPQAAQEPKPIWNKQYQRFYTHDPTTGVSKWVPV